MRRRFAALLVLISLLALPPAASARTAACSSSGSTAVYASKSARVFTKRAIVKPRYRVRRYYGCAYRYNRKFRLATVGEPGVFETAVTQIRLAGRFVAHASFYEGPAGGTYAVVRVRDLRSGVQTVNIQAGAPLQPGEPDTSDQQARIRDLELRPNGSVAAITGTNDPATGVPIYRVIKRDPAGTAVLDSGPDIDPTSLALSGGILYWTKAGQPHSATLG
jgi:hypothetical protein